MRTLIRDYLIDEDQGAGAGRNPISSINEILREGKFTRDKNKVWIIDSLIDLVFPDERFSGGLPLC